MLEGTTRTKCRCGVVGSGNEKEREKGIGGAEGTRIGCEQSVPGAATYNADPQNPADLKFYSIFLTSP